MCNKYTGLVLKPQKSVGWKSKSNFTAVFTQSRAHLLDRIDREGNFQIQTSNSLSISAQGFLRMNTDS